LDAEVGRQPSSLLLDAATMVLSQLLAPLLAKALGSFVKPECLEEDSLRVGIWRGHVQLSNLCLREDLLDLLGLPLTLRYARCVLTCPPPSIECPDRTTTTTLALWD
jgi:hypothetical protein